MNKVFRFYLLESLISLEIAFFAIYYRTILSILTICKTKSGLSSPSGFSALWRGFSGVRFMSY